MQLAILACEFKKRIPRVIRRFAVVFRPFWIQIGRGADVGTFVSWFVDTAS